MAKKIMILAGRGEHTGYPRIFTEELESKSEFCFLAPNDNPLSVTIEI